MVLTGLGWPSWLTATMENAKRKEGSFLFLLIIKYHILLYIGIYYVLQRPTIPIDSIKFLTFMKNVLKDYSCASGVQIYTSMCLCRAGHLCSLELPSGGRALDT